MLVCNCGASATDPTKLSSPYFVPDQSTERTLVDAVKRGVTVRIILPGDPSDAPFVRSASRARWGKLLEAGAQIYEYQPTMYHCKVMIVDTLMVSVGSTNFDTRSFRLNDEANLNIYSAEFALAQLKIFNADLERSRQVSLDEWQRRPLPEKAYDIVASMFGAQL